MKYSTAVLDRVGALDRAGSLPAGAGVGVGQAGSLDEGTLVRIWVRAADGRIAESRFKVFGCSAAIASASLVAERLEGASVDTGRALRAVDIADALGLPEERRHVADLAVQAARAALDAVGQEKAGGAGRKP
jgi:NifU-like protein involved in Fe-S cluster formation